jgi:hypothetical protein
MYSARILYSAKYNVIALLGVRFGQISTKTLTVSLAVVLSRSFVWICKSRRRKSAIQTASVQLRIRQHENPDGKRRKLRHLKNKWFQPYIHRWGSRCLLIQLWRTLDRLCFLDLARAQISNHMHPTLCLTFMPHLHAVPAGVIFPGFTPGTVYNPVTTVPSAPTPPVSLHSPSPSSAPEIKTEPEESFSPSLPPTSSLSVSLLELTPNNSSSSLPEENDGQDAAAHLTETCRASASVSPRFDISAFLVVPEEAPLDALAPGVTLLNSKPSTGENEVTCESKKGKEEAVEKDSYKVSHIDWVIIDLIRNNKEALSPPSA